ncbi:MAG: hypothetical protein ABIJ61_08960 [bacterium]
MRAGLGYELLSQEYFLDSAAVTDTDSTLTNWSLTTNYLDELKGQLTVRYVAPNSRRFETGLNYEQTKEFIRGRLDIRHRLELGSHQLEWQGELEARQRYRGEAAFGDSYLQGWARTKWTMPLSSTLDWQTFAKLNAVRFKDPADYNYNHRRLTLRSGLQKIFDNFSMADAAVYVTQRQVPDSSSLNYLAIGLDWSLLGFYTAGEVDFLGLIESKNYELPDGRDDHWRLDIDGRNRVRVADLVFAKQTIEVEIMRYTGGSFINTDYSRLGLAALIGLDWNSLEVGLGPSCEWLRQNPDTTLDAEDYLELAAHAQIDLLLPGSALISLNSESGRRKLEFPTDFQSSFYFERLSLIGDVSFSEHLGYTLLFSSEWEWHDRETDNATLYLLSTNLTWTF